MSLSCLERHSTTQLTLVSVCLALSTCSRLHENDAQAGRSLCGTCGALKCVSSITAAHVFSYHRGVISWHTQIKFSVSPESIHTFHFPVDPEETVCFYWAGITPAAPWGGSSSASLGSYFVFVNGTPPGK